MSRIGDKLKDARSRRGMSQKELAKKCGISESFISEVESGRRVINEQMVKRMSGVLGVDLSEPMYEEEAAEEEIREEQTTRVDIKKAPMPEWQSAFSSIIKDIPVYNLDMNKIIGYKSLPIIEKKVEGHNPEKLIYIRVADNTMGGFRIKKDDFVMVALGSELSNGLYFLEYDGEKAIRQLKMLGGNKILVMSNDNEVKTDTRDIHELKILGRCVKIEINL